MTKKRLIVVIAIFIILMPLASASFQLGNESFSLPTSYSPREKLKGWINISFDREVADKLLTADDFNGGTRLKKFLDNNSASYECFPSGCINDYLTSNPTGDKSFSLNYNGEKVIGTELTGKVDEDSVARFKFDLSVNNQPTCLNPLEIDILGNKEKIWDSSKASDDYSCTVEGGMGCFEYENTSEVRLGENKYCEEIELPPGEKFKIGAWVRKNRSWEEGLLTMELYKGDNLVSEGQCEINESQLSDGKEVGCVVNYENEEMKKYYVCLDVSKTTQYKIKRESDNSCGFYGSPSSPSGSFDYSIFARGAKFDTVGSINFNQTLYQPESRDSLTRDIDNYLGNYNYNCTNGCPLPIKFKAYTDLDIEVSNLLLTYYSGGSPIDETSIYDLSEKSPELSSDYLKLDLKKSGIKVPEDYGNHTLRLELGGEGILSEEKEIMVKKIPVINSLSPTQLPAAKKTEFRVNTYSPANRSIVRYKWIFGNTTKTTNNSKISHTYSSLGQKDLTVEVEDSKGLVGKKTFKVIVGSPKEVVNRTIEVYLDRLDNLTNQLVSMPNWKKEVIEERLNIKGLKDEVRMWERRYNNRQDYVEIMSNLSEVDIPISITGDKGSIPYFVNYKDVRPSLFEELGAGSIDSDKNYKKAIAAWSQDNLEMTLEFSNVLAHYEDSTEKITNFYTLKISPEKSEGEDIYVIIEDPQIRLDGSYNTKDFSDAVAIMFEEIKNKNIEFSSDKNIDEIVIYPSPDFKQLQFEVEAGPCNQNGECEEGETVDNCPADCKPYGWATFWIILLILLGVGTYIFLQVWYRKHYESHLFKNRNSIYNLVQYIKNAKNRGMGDKEIKKKLKKAGWSGEQVSYVFKKYYGKPIMPLDLLSLLQKVRRKTISLFGKIKISRGKEKPKAKPVPKPAKSLFRK